jgi:branched-chain amino acid transport system ATP-binding protein/branched-chain amino acid transport system permease protein
MFVALEGTRSFMLSELSPMSEITLECQDLSKSFGGVCAVNDVDFAFQAGKITALIGPNGAGKTTLFHLITGILKPDTGDVLYRGRSFAGLQPWDVARLGIGRLFQDIRVFDRLSVLENILVAFQEKQIENPLAGLIRRNRIRRKEKEHVGHAERLLELVNLAEHCNVAAEELSYGQQKLLAIARLLASNSDVFLLDEPTAGVNPTLVQRLLDVIRDLANGGKTVVVIEHNMSVVLEVADWAYFMDDGQVTAFGLPQEVLGDATVRARYLGL